MKKNKLGIVMLSYNRADVVVPCLESLIRAKNDTNFELFLIDNASQENDFKLIKGKFIELNKGGSLNGVFRKSEKNLGFPAGNNVGIKYFLNKKDITHICLLNSDVIVTDYWIDHLINNDFDCVGPVTNACGNEQTIPSEIDFGSLRKGFELINNFAEKRRSIYNDYSVPTIFLGFFCFIAKKDVFTKVGYLDERFGTGGFEDDDYCIRINRAGFKMYINRGVYIQHWGSSSFSQIPPSELVSHLNNNKKIFEEKYDKSWEERKLLPLQSFYQDMDYLITRQSIYTESEFKTYYQETLDLIKNLESENKILKNSNLMKSKLERSVIFILRMPKKIFTLLKIIFLPRKILFLVKYPQNDDLKDGYYQRVKVIDNMLNDHNRFYFNPDAPVSWSIPQVSKIKDKVYEIRFNNKRTHKAIIIFIGLFFSRVYSHSILRLDSKLRRTIFSISRKRILDIHGVVPEEFKMHNDEVGYSKFTEIESFAVKKANIIVSVTKKMADHVMKKHDIPDKKVILLPIIQKKKLNGNVSKKYSTNIIYSGGLQKWQQVEKMIDFAQSVSGKAKVTFLVPEPEKLKPLIKSNNVEVVTANSEDVSRWYDNNSFGLVLREDVIVNRVACPTKIIEYFQHNLVPIVDSPEIGDFPEMGYKYINYKEPLPSENEWLKMINANKSVLKKYYSIFDKGIEDLRRNI